MQTLLIVEVEVALQGSPEWRFGIEALLVQAFDLEGVEEGFHVCVVIHGARAIHALNEAMTFELVLEGARAVLDAAVRVEVNAWGRASILQGLVQCGDGQRRSPAGPQAPAQDAAREAIHDHGQVAPLARDLEVSDIADPQLVDHGDGLTSDRVGHSAEEIHRATLAAEEMIPKTLQASHAHKTGDAASTDDVPLPTQQLGHSGAAVAQA